MNYPCIIVTTLSAISHTLTFVNHRVRDTIIVTLGNCATSVFAGVVIFSFIGFMAGEMNAEVKDVVDKGRYHSCYAISITCKHLCKQTMCKYSKYTVLIIYRSA